MILDRATSQWGMGLVQVWHRLVRTSLDIEGDLPHDWFSGVIPERAMSDSQQYIYPVFEQQKADLLLHLLEKNSDWRQVLVFLRTREGVHELASELNKADIRTESLHGKQKQEVKDRSLRSFQEGGCRVLVVTDALARAMDWSGTAVVVNYDYPELEEDYLTRIAAVSLMSTFVTPQNKRELESLEAKLGLSLELLVADDFAYDPREIKERVVRNKTKKKGPRSKPLEHKKKKWKPKKYTR